MKRILSVVLTGMLLLSLLTGVQAEPADGVYEGSAEGRNGAVTVSVQIENGAVAAVSVTAHNETPGISDPAIEKIPVSIVENQSVAVDVVAGATVTSNAILEATKEALLAAGMDVEAFSAVKETVAGETVEIDADVVVIGAGGAGMAAAVTAAEAGASVVVIEKTAAAGGNTIVSGGYLNAVDPARAAKMGPEDVSGFYALCDKEPLSERHAYWQNELRTALDEYFAGPQDHMFDCIALHVLQTYDGGDYVADLTLVENVIMKAPDAVAWLEGIGMLYDTEALYQVTGGLWPRGHKAIKPNGTGYFEVLFDYITEKNLDITFCYETRATHFIVEDGCVVGVRAESVADGTPYVFHAKKNTVLTTGGFGANVEMRERYNTHWASLDATVNSSEVAAATGDGITMSLEIGAQLVGMEWIQLHPLISPAGKKAVAVATDTEHYIQVNWEGNRYIAEDARRDELSQAGLLQTDGEMWEITDVNGIYASVDSLVDAGYCYRADTLEDLAAQIGVPVDNFVAAVEQYNHAVDTGVDEAFGRKLLKFRIDTAPFYAGLCKPGVHHTMGGVKIDTDCHVYNEADEIIPGLFAAGEITGGIHGSNRVGGNAIADIFVNGRTAGANAAE